MTPVWELGLSVRSTNCLQRANIKTFGDILNYSYSNLSNIRNMGRKSVDEVVDFVRSAGYELKSEK